MGNALNFFLIWAWAKRERMSIALRIDDIDRSRFRVEYLDDIFAALDWLKLEHHFGPVSPDDFLRNYTQNMRMEKYLDAARALLASGLAYYCNCSRRKIEERFGTSSYQGYCRDKHLKDGTLRLNLENCYVAKFLDNESFHEFLKEIGDFALVDRDVRATYQLVSVIDDVHLGITHIMRGEDLLASTKVQRLLAKTLNLASFSSMTFRFHPLVRSPDGHKLSKSEGAFALQNLYRKAASPTEFYLWASGVLGVAEKCESAEQLADSLAQNFFENDFLRF
ncbi:MAG: hypothetical protein A2X86_20695 [Bdellovibrionales bacterium GWA2_49_15]|nr:MAG: hypothetical protein A2X86_20695 [Bdellovibrionales bacterium GWA2_49_15]